MSIVASSGVNEDGTIVDVLTPANILLFISTSPKTIQPAGCNEERNESLHDAIDSPTFTT